jgi:plasmid stability protein
VEQDMATLVVRNIPDDLMNRLKARAMAHRRSMTQEAILSLEAALDADATPATRPSVEETLDWLRREVWTLPVLDARSEDEILGYNEQGIFH